MQEFVAVLGMTVTVDQTTPIPAGAVTAVITPDPPSATKVFAGGQLVYRSGDTIQVSGITVPSAGATIPDSGPYQVAITATATKFLVEGSLILREGDLSAIVSATPQIPGSPPTDYPVTFQCVISAAGQIKVLAQ